MEKIAVTPAKAAEITSLSRSTITTAIETGCINSVSIGKVGNKKVVLVSDLDDFLHKCSILGT